MWFEVVVSEAMVVVVDVVEAGVDKGEGTGFSYREDEKVGVRKWLW